MPYSVTTWADSPATSSPISAANLNKIETELARLKVNADLDPAAAIAYSKLALALSIVNGDISASAAIAASKLAGYPTDGTKALYGDGTWKVPLQELAYVEITAPVTVSATTEATATSIASAGAVTFDGTTRVCIEFFSPTVIPAAAAGAAVTLVLYDGTSIGFFGQIFNPAANAMDTPVLLRRYLTPSAATHTYSVRAYQGGGNGTVQANVGGAGAMQPSYIRITRA